jgi:hypothetical protein
MKKTKWEKLYTQAEMEKAVSDTAMQAYLECLAVECGEGECARAVASKFKLETKE